MFFAMRKATPSANTIVVMAGCLAGSLGLAVACGGTAVIDPGSSGGSGGAGSGAAGGATSTNTTSTSTSMSTSSSMTTVTTGGGPCVSCSQYLLDDSGTVQFEDLCGFQGGTSCAPGSSCEAYQEVELCACGSTMQPGMCAIECEFFCTGMGTDSPPCQTCVVNNCSAQTNNCLADPGTP